MKENNNSVSLRIFIWKTWRFWVPFILEHGACSGHPWNEIGMEKAFSVHFHISPDNRK